MPRLEDASDEEIGKEIQRRKEAAARARLEEGLAQYDLLEKLMKAAPEETLALLAPAHVGRGYDCNDASTHMDGFTDQGHIECYRCFLLSVKNGNRAPDPIHISGFYIQYLQE